jgi:hypothetical protein
MQLSNILHTLLGAALVSIGFLLAALADRIKTGRAARAVRESVPSEQVSRPLRAPIPVVEPADLLRPTPAVKPVRAARPESKPADPKANTEGGDDVIAALVAAGYKKPIATEATWACTAAERATIECWTASALRRCARGGLS